MPLKLPVIDPKTGLVKMKLPSTLGGAADALYQLRQYRLAVDGLVAAMKKTETHFKEQLIKKFKKDELHGARGKIGGLEINRKNIPKIEDDKAFYKFVKKSGRFDLLQRRLNESAINEMWEAKKTIPGIGKFTVVSLSVHKVKGGGR